MNASVFHCVVDFEFYFMETVFVKFLVSLSLQVFEIWGKVELQNLGNKNNTN